MANRRSNVVSIAKGLPRVSAGDEKQDEYLPRVFGVSNSLLTAITPKHFDVLDIIYSVKRSSICAATEMLALLFPSTYSNNAVVKIQLLRCATCERKAFFLYMKL